MESLNVGRPAIREAMQRLSQMGLVEIRHGGRARVSQPSMVKMIDQLGATVRHLLTHAPASVENLRQARAVFEAQMASLAAERALKGDVDRLRAILEEQTSSVDDPSRFVELDGEFHKEVAAISGNPIFPAVSEAIFKWLMAYRQDLIFREKLILPTEAARLTIAEHHAVIDAIEAGQPAKAAQAVKDHIHRAWRETA